MVKIWNKWLHYFINWVYTALLVWEFYISWIHYWIFAYAPVDERMLHWTNYIRSITKETREYLSNWSCRELLSSQWNFNMNSAFFLFPFNGFLACFAFWLTPLRTFSHFPPHITFSCPSFLFPSIFTLTYPLLVFGIEISLPLSFRIFLSFPRFRFTILCKYW